MEDLRFATENEALQYLADVTGKKIKIAADPVQTGQAEVDEFKDAYIEAMFFSSTDESDEQGGEPLDKNYDESDISPELMKKINEDCKDFIAENYEYIKDDLERAGHDFWFTRNGHGAGFWDGDWEFEVDGNNAGKHLTEASKAYGELNVYVGDDGKLYGM